MKNLEIKRNRYLATLFAALFIFTVGTVSVFGADQKPAKPAQAAPQVPEFKLESTKFETGIQKKRPSIYNKAQIDEAAALIKVGKIPKLPKVDLVCSIKAYYDMAHTMPVASGGPNMGIYHLSPQQSPPRPLPWHVFFEVEVKNIGVVSKALNVTNRVNFISPTAPALFPPKQFITVPETLDPGEAVEFKYYWGYFGPTPALHNKIIQVHGLADFPPHVAEDSETNNACTYTLRFVMP